MRLTRWAWNIIAFDYNSFPSPWFYVFISFSTIVHRLRYSVNLTLEAVFLKAAHHRDETVCVISIKLYFFICQLSRSQNNQWKNMFFRVYQTYIFSGFEGLQSIIQRLRKHHASRLRQWLGQVTNTAQNWHQLPATSLRQCNWQIPCHNASDLSHFLSNPSTPDSPQRKTTCTSLRNEASHNRMTNYATGGHRFKIGLPDLWLCDYNTQWIIACERYDTKRFAEIRPQ